MIRLVTCGVAVCVLTAGCGGMSATQKAKVNLDRSVALVAIEETYGDVLHDVAHRPARLERDLGRFDTVARTASKSLGKRRVRLILAEKATAIGGICGECAAAFDRTRATL